LVDDRERRAAHGFGMVPQTACATGMRRSGKYSGLTKFTRTSGFSDAVLPIISMFCRQPLEGGVALVEMPAATTCGIAASLARICSKYSARSFHATCVF